MKDHAHIVTDALSKMPAEHLACRDYGHSWRPFTAEWRPKERAYHVQLRCDRCGTLRERWLDRNGGQVSAQYKYADGYLVAGVGRLTGSDRDAVRLASVLNMLPQKEARRA